MKAKLIALAGLAVFATQSMATSVFDAASKASITTGFTDMRDTTLDIVTTSMPMFIAILAIMFGPRIVKKMAKSAG